MIDGYPISLQQAAAFEKDVTDVKVIILLEVPNDKLKERLTKRNNFDDTEDSINKRIANYNSKTLPILDKYSAKVKKIDANRSKDEVFDDIKKIFESL